MLSPEKTICHLYKNAYCSELEQYIFWRSVLVICCVPRSRKAAKFNLYTRDGFGIICNFVTVFLPLALVLMCAIPARLFEPWLQLPTNFNTKDSWAPKEMFRILVKRIHGEFPCISKSILNIFKSVGYSFIYEGKNERN